MGFQNGYLEDILGIYTKVKLDLYGIYLKGKRLCVEVIQDY